MMKKKELVAVLAVLILALAVWLLLFPSSGSGVREAVVIVDGTEVLTIELEEGKPSYVIDLQGTYGIPASIEVDGGRVRFVDVTCPDHICEQAGWLSAENQTAVCMPNKSVLAVRSKA